MDAACRHGRCKHRLCLCLYKPVPRSLQHISPFLSLVRVASQAYDCSSHRPGEWDCPNQFGPVRTSCWSWGEDLKWNPIVPRRRRREWPLVRHQIVSACYAVSTCSPSGSIPQNDLWTLLSQEMLVNGVQWKSPHSFGQISLGSVWWSIVLSQIYSAC